MKKLKLSFAMMAMVIGVSAAFATKAPGHRFLNQFANTSTTSTEHWVPQTRLPGSTTGKYTCEADARACTAFFSNPPTSPPADGTDAPDNETTELGIYTIH
ncbi:MAG: hypothetical protein JWQ66_2377 [Mucilaginibacter sp.]|nr:hypothetical protein [Mucilaginibacter sp.]